MIKENQINKMIQSSKKLGWLNTNDITDGFHTFGELYEHRNRLFISMCKILYYQNFCPIWRKPIENGWFLMGINLEEGKQISYHLPESLFSETDFLQKNYSDNYSFDGHTSQDVLKRLKKLF